MQKIEKTGMRVILEDKFFCSPTFLKRLLRNENKIFIIEA